ncbi:hypothetical protein Mapa_017738 [Marchantia paleacea]|nr:hypothetical protein Mapa_017738 [Marchantia paleacea]
MKNVAFKIIFIHLLNNNSGLAARLIYFNSNNGWSKLEAKWYRATNQLMGGIVVQIHVRKCGLLISMSANKTTGR